MVQKKKEKKKSCLQPLKKQFPAGQTTFIMSSEYWSRSGNISPACTQLICGAHHEMDISRRPRERRRVRLRVSWCERLTESARHRLGGLGVIKAEPQVSGKGIMALMQMASLWRRGGPARLWYDCRVCVLKRFPHKHPCLFKQREVMQCPSRNGAPGS